MTTQDFLPTNAPQSGERGSSLAAAWEKGTAAVAELGLTAEVIPLVEGSPGSWMCRLREDGAAVPGGTGSGKGDREAARVGSVFEALEHYLSGLAGLPLDETFLRDSNEIARGPLAGDAAVALLADKPGEPIACLRYEALDGGPGTDVPLFLSIPDYLAGDATAVRAALGDHHDYTMVGRYSANNGWAAGADPVEALVHALNETVERDALSLLLIEQFLADAPLRVVDRETLPPDLAALLAQAERHTGTEVHLLDMTTDLGVPAYYAYLPAEPGQPARIRGCGASLSRGYAITRSLTELVQIHSILGSSGGAAGPIEERTDWTAPYPALHACYLADFTPGLRDAELVRYEDSAVPGSPQGHLDLLLDILLRHGFKPYSRYHYTTGNLAVVNVFVPGLERFMLITDGQLIVPGERGLAARARHQPST